MNNIFGILNWITPNIIPVALLFVVLKFVSKRIHSKPLDRFFMKIHIPFGWILLGCTVYHTAATLISGQTMTMQGGGTYTIPTIVFVSGLFATLSFLVAVGSYIGRKKIKGKWLIWHRSATVVAIAATIWHLAVWFGQKG